MSDVTPAQRRRSEDFHFGARVFSSDGRHIGSVRFVIVDRESSDVHALVVKETRRFSGHHEVVAALMEDDIAIPIAAVRDAERGQVTLSITSAEARRAAPYLTYQLAALDRGDEERVLIAEAGGGMFVPPLLEEARKRLDELEIRRGENVMLGHTGKRLGTVRDVVLDGGELEVEVGEDLHVNLTGWARPVFEGRLSEEFEKELHETE